MQKLERNIKDLHELFVDMSLLVEHQDEAVGRIEYNVGTATVHVEQGLANTRKAAELACAARKVSIFACIKSQKDPSSEETLPYHLSHRRSHRCHSRRSHLRRYGIWLVQEQKLNRSHTFKFDPQ